MPQSGDANAWLLDLDNFSSHITKDSGASGASMIDPPFQNSYTFKWLSHARAPSKQECPSSYALTLCRRNIHSWFERTEVALNNHRLEKGSTVLARKLHTAPWRPALTP